MGKAHILKYSSSVFIVEAKRSPIGRLGGTLAPLAAPKLAEAVASQVLQPHQAAGQVAHVVWGQGLQAGSGMNLSRQVALQTGCPLTTPAYTVNMVCGSGLQAVALAAQAITNQEAAVALAGGAESMSGAPHYVRLRQAHKLGHDQLEDAILRDGLTDPLHQVSMGETAERLADLHQISREDQDAFAVRSHHLALEHQASFQREIVGLAVGKEFVDTDEAPRANTTQERLARLAPVFRNDGTVTAGNASGINDGAACLLLADETACGKQGWKPRARVVASAITGCDPLLMGLGPVSAINKVLEEAGWSLEEVDALEINEAFAAQTLACARQLGLDQNKLNLRGGAIALGHPIGASGARVLVTLLHILEDNNWRRGIAALCIGGGMGIAMAIER